MSKVTLRLVELACILANWADPASGTVIYLHGSRVRGDYRTDSDVDVSVDFLDPHEDDLYWWSENNDDGFAAINTKLGS
jgi:predicted nucleotidyltransferase